MNLPRYEAGSCDSAPPAGVATILPLTPKRRALTARIAARAGDIRGSRHASGRGHRAGRDDLGNVVPQLGRDAAAAFQRAVEHMGADRRSVLRPRRSRQGPVLAPLGEPATGCRRLCARLRRRRRARHAGWTVGMGDARARSDLPGAAHGAAAGLAAALARGVPRWAALRDLRHLHHGDLADHHQYRRRHPQHPAGLPERGESAAPQSP